MYAPRAAVHEALLRPHTFLGGAEQEWVHGTFFYVIAMMGMALVFRISG